MASRFVRLRRHFTGPSFPMGLFSDVSASLLILWATMLLVLPLNWLLAALAAMVVHEVCHAIAIILSGGRILRLRITGSGLRMDTAPMNPLQELVCVLAGPVGSLGLLVLTPVFPMLALCGLVQGVYNLIPLYPMDGGRALRCLLFGFLSEKQAERVFSLSETFFCLLLCLLLFGISARLEWRSGPVLAGSFLLFRLWKEKLVAKKERSG